MASGDTLSVFFASDNEPPTTGFARAVFHNLHPSLGFLATTTEAAVFSGHLDAAYTGGGITINLLVMTATATTGNLAFSAAIERGGTTLDHGTDSFATAVNGTTTAVSGTAGTPVVVPVTITDGAAMDSLAAGEMFRIKISNITASTTISGDAELLQVEIKET